MESEKLQFQGLKCSAFKIYDEVLQFVLLFPLLHLSLSLKNVLKLPYLLSDMNFFIIWLTVLMNKYLKQSELYILSGYNMPIQYQS